MIVEAPEAIRRGEQIGLRLDIFNNWDQDLEVNSVFAIVWMTTDTEWVEICLYFYLYFCVACKWGVGAHFFPREVIVNFTNLSVFVSVPLVHHVENAKTYDFNVVHSIVQGIARAQSQGTARGTNVGLTYLHTVRE